MISNWLQAHRVAQLVAIHAQEELGVSREAYVDVFAAIRRADIALMLEALPGHFGTYISPVGGGPGILVNSTLSLAAIRHTAAHELGHHQFEHGDSNDLQLDPWESQRPGAWTGPEMSAEAFAAWFLMPRPAVLGGLRLMGVDRPRSALDAYRLAQMLGVSYRGLCRHLANLRLVTASTAQDWAKVRRARLRQALAGPHAATTTRDVHLLDARMSGATVHVPTGDLLVTPAWAAEQHPAAAGAAASLEPVGTRETSHELPFSDQSDTKCWRVTGQTDAPIRLAADNPPSGAEEWSVTVRPVHVRQGIDLHWLERHQDRSHT